MWINPFEEFYLISFILQILKGIMSLRILFLLGIIELLFCSLVLLIGSTFVGLLLLIQLSVGVLSAKLT